MNLLQETIDFMALNKKSNNDIDFINYCEMTINWEDFKDIAESEFYDYDDGYGTAKVPQAEIVFKDNSWLERYEYDGSECWTIKFLPKRFDDILVKKLEPILIAPSPMSNLIAETFNYTGSGTEELLVDLPEGYYVFKCTNRAENWKPIVYTKKSNCLGFNRLNDEYLAIRMSPKDFENLMKMWGKFG